MNIKGVMKGVTGRMPGTISVIAERKNPKKDLDVQGSKLAFLKI